MCMYINLLVDDKLVFWGLQFRILYNHYVFTTVNVKLRTLGTCNKGYFMGTCNNGYFMTTWRTVKPLSLHSVTEIFSAIPLDNSSIPPEVHMYIFICNNYIYQHFPSFCSLEINLILWIELSKFSLLSNTLFKYREKKEEIWLSPMTKAHTPTEMSKGQSDNTHNATKKFDHTAVADRLRTVSWSNYGHPTGVVNLVYGPTPHNSRVIKRTHV